MARILVADDDDSVLQGVGRLLEAMGHKPKLASNGKEAMDLLEAGEEYDLIISDMRMPFINGMELLRFVKSRKEIAATPFILHSSDEHLEPVCESAGGTFARKGDDLAELVEEVLGS